MTASPPTGANSRGMENQMTEILELIQTKEARLKSLSIKPDDSMQSQLRALRAEKNTAIEQRRNIINPELTALNQHVTKKKEELSKIKIGLPYRSESRIEETIRKLELELKNRNFKLSEEKKIVAEIDGLKRSKKALAKANIMEAEVNMLKDKQKSLRQDGEYYFKKVSSLKSREEELKKKMHNAMIESESLKREIDELHNQKRVLTTELKKQEKQKLDNRKKHRQESLKKRARERQDKEERIRKEREEIAALREPYEEERHLCTTLVTYLQPYLSNNEQQSLNSSLTSLESDISPRSPRDAPVLGATGGASIPDNVEDGMYVLLQRKSDDADVPLYGANIVRRTSSKKNRKERRRTLPKIISHTPETLAQFAALNLTAPSCPAEVRDSIQQLNTLKRCYAQQADDILRNSPQRSTADDVSPGRAAAPPSESSGVSVDDFDLDGFEDDDESTPSLGRSLDPSEVEVSMHFRKMATSSSTDSELTAVSSDDTPTTEDKPLPGQQVIITPPSTDENCNEATDNLSTGIATLNIAENGNGNRLSLKMPSTGVLNIIRDQSVEVVTDPSSGVYIPLDSTQSLSQSFHGFCRCENLFRKCSFCRNKSEFDRVNAAAIARLGSIPAIVTSKIGGGDRADEIAQKDDNDFMTSVQGKWKDDGTVDYIEIDGNTSSNPESPQVLSNTPPRFSSSSCNPTTNLAHVGGKENIKSTEVMPLAPPVVHEPNIS